MTSKVPTIQLSNWWVMASINTWRVEIPVRADYAALDSDYNSD